eukprot:gene11775-biopygen21425
MGRPETSLTLGSASRQAATQHTAKRATQQPGRRAGKRRRTHHRVIRKLPKLLPVVNSSDISDSGTCQTIASTMGKTWHIPSTNNGYHSSHSKPGCWYNPHDNMMRFNANLTSSGAPPNQTPVCQVPPASPSGSRAASSMLRCSAACLRAACLLCYVLCCVLGCCMHACYVACFAAC